MRFVALVVIASSESEDRLKAIAKEGGAENATVIQARGSKHDEQKRSFFSLTYEGSQVVLLYILEEKLSKKVLKEIKLSIDKDRVDAMAFTMPISHIVGLDESMLDRFEESIKSIDF